VENGLLLVAILLFNVLQYWWSSQSRVQPVPYSDFERALAQGRVAEVLISEQYVRGELKSPEPGGKTAIAAAASNPHSPDDCRSTTCPIRA